MRLPTLTVAAALTLAAASPAIAATTTVSAPAPIEQLLIDVSVLHADSLKALKNAGDNEDAVRDVLDEWRLALIDAEDELAELREDARDLDGKLTKAQAAEFDEARETIREERAEVRELRVELLPEDETVYVPEAVRVLGGLLDVVTVDAVERSAEGKNVVYGLPGADAQPTGQQTAPTTEQTTAAKPATEPKPTAQATTPKPSAPLTPSAPTSVRYTAERRADDADPSSSNGNSASDSSGASGSETTTPATTPTTTSPTTSPTTTTEATTTAPTSIMENRRTSASTTTTPTTSSTYSSTSTTPTTTSTWDDDDERDDDLAETGSPMLSLIVLGALATLAGLVLMRRPA